MTARLHPRTEALAFRIWAWCRAHGWEHTAAEVADALDETPRRVARAARSKGWSGRLRAMGQAHSDGATTTIGRGFVPARITPDNARAYGLHRSMIA
jgi:hypothetical protein